VDNQEQRTCEHKRRVASSPGWVTSRLNLNLQARGIQHSYVTAECASLNSALNKRHEQKIKSSLERKVAIPSTTS
jgi:hypothetical protein